MKIVKFSTTPNDEWMIAENIIMYRCQEGSLYDDDIEYKESSIVEAVSAMLDPRFPRLPQPHIIERLQGTELGNLINQFQEGKLIFTPLAMFEEWEEKISATHDKLVEFGEIPEGFAVQVEEGFISWDLYLEIFCQQAPIPERCWVEIEKSSGYELIEVVNRKPQYKVESSFSFGVEFKKVIEVIDNE